MMSARHIAAVLAICGAISCATYRLGPTPTAPDGRGDRDRRAVAVETVATPAEWAMDAGRLTRTLVDHLARRGFDAAWEKADEAPAAVHCSADGPPPTAFRANRAARVDLRCRIQGRSTDPTVVTARGSAAAGAPVGAETRLADTAATVMHEATADALGRVAPQIADILAGPSSPQETQ